MGNAPTLPAVGLLALSLLALSLLTSSLGATAALAQSAVPDEAVQPNGAVTQQLALTAGQKSAIYNAVFRQRVRQFTNALHVIMLSFSRSNMNADHRFQHVIT